MYTVANVYVNAVLAVRPIVMLTLKVQDVFATISTAENTIISMFN